MKTSIYMAYHKPSPRAKSDSIIPIHVGRANAPGLLPNMLGDDTGETISERNGSWCELTGLYWAWKNGPESDVVGLMHYSRLLDFTGRVQSGAVESKPEYLNLTSWCEEAEAWIAEEGGKYDIVLPRLHQMGRTVDENYRAGHAERDWDILRDVIASDYTEYLESFDAIANGRKIRLGNMALMTRPFFDRYCTWLFDILFKVEATPEDRSQYTVQETRYLGFLSERLMTVFVHHELRTNPELRLHEVSILNLTQGLISPFISAEDQPDPTAINIAFTSDENYLPHAAAMLRSVIETTSAERPLNLYFMHDNIPAGPRSVLASMLAERKNCTLHTINTYQYFKDCYGSGTRAASNTTYNRLLMFELFPGLDKLLYLDVDIVARRDLAELYDTDMGDNQIAAVPDWIMTRVLTGPIPTVSPDVPDLGEYLRLKLDLSDAQIARYFNAGILLINLRAIPDVAALGQRLVKDAHEARYLFRDQDILNKHFKDRLMTLDGRWNVFNSPVEAFGKVPKYLFAQAMAARKDPWIIHFADRHKPWNRRPIHQAGHYWEALSRTPFYGEVVARLTNVKKKKRGGGQLQEPERESKTLQLGRSVADRVPALKGPMLRVYSKFKGNARRS